MMNKSMLFVLTLLAAATAGAQQSAPRPGALSLKTVVQKIIQVEDQEGGVRTELVAADVAVPGDEVVYTVTFTNIGAEPAENVLITNPIPAEMRYTPGTAFGPGSAIEYSADGGVHYADSESLYVSAANGSERLASAEEYTHIRWQLSEPLAPGAQGIARFRAIVR